jgi:maltose O-acetyltransferase
MPGFMINSANRLIDYLLLKINDYKFNILLSRGLKIGDNCVMLDDVRIDSSHCGHIEIGNNVTLAPGVIILAHDASLKRHLGFTRIGKVKIGDNVFIGARSIILPNISIGQNSIIGAGSVVTRDIPENVVAVGNPAKVLCSLDNYLNKHRELMTNNPCFGEKYTFRMGVSKIMIEEMNNKMTDGLGYIR